MTVMPPQLETSWQQILKNEWSRPYMLDLATFVAEERRQAVVYPPKDRVFTAPNLTPYEKVSVVIMGQDPYHGEGQAHGLSFSVPKGVTMPPSLKNIFKELQEDLGVAIPSHGCLEGWAAQGVLLLNAVLTVRAKCPGSHHNKGWEQFTDAIIMALCEREDPVIFVLWGKSAQQKCRHILGSSNNRHFILTAAHPSPYSAYAGFFGCRHFSKINQQLTKMDKKPIDWEIK